ncbi:hypothetical protein [Bacillus paramycoides]|nr:hypothetical protein [Bacillus paramycoides]MED0968512.1 hypothetical protein [Bacillus paramycoides]MED1113319.1 hypothetical protein [Bacillus paramycoides]MED1555586.1 hypothetical protein [Bacillus paramycoides]
MGKVRVTYDVEFKNIDLSRYLPGSKTPTSKFGWSKAVRWELINISLYI